MDESEESPSIPPAKPSKTPSWVMLGFLLGALFVWSLQKSPEAAAVAPIPAQAASLALSAPPPAPRLAAVEAVFAEWGQYAVWDKESETTEVALWTPETQNYSDFYEVYRSGDRYFFRSIPRLTRPLLTHGVPDNPLMVFTETVTQRKDWLRESAKGNWPNFSGTPRETTDKKPSEEETRVPLVTPTPHG